MPKLDGTLIYVLVFIFFMITMFLFNAVMNHRKLVKTTSGKLVAVFHQPGGGEVMELCETHGVFVFRGREERKGSVFQTKKDVGTAREVYILQVPGASHDDLEKAVEETRAVMEEASQDASEVMESVANTGMFDRKARKEAAEVATDIQNRVEAQLHTQWDTLISKSMSSRGHILYPVIMPPNKVGLLQSQVALPVAHFIENCTLEIDPVSVALGKFEADPLYNSAMVGSIVDQRLLELAAWFSSYIDKLEQQLIKMINPNILYMLLGLTLLISLISVYFGFSQRSTISQMAEQMDQYMALLPK